MTAFPNPVYDMAVIPVSFGFGSSNIEINIYNILGQKQDVRYEIAPGPENAAFTIDCSHLLPGIYYYIVTADENKWSGTFVVAR